MDLEVRSTYSTPYLPESISASCSSSCARSSCSRSSCFFSLNCVAMRILYYGDMDVTTQSLEEFNKESSRFVAGLSPHNHNAILVTLSGELGAGEDDRAIRV